MVGTVHLLFFYPILILNLVLLGLMGYLWFSPGLLFFFGFTLFSGVVGILQGTDSVALLLKSLIGLWLGGLYACSFLRFMKFDAAGCFQRYARAAYYVAVIGLFIYPLQLVFEGVGARLHSFELEPGEFCIVCVPAIYYFADRWQRLRVDGGKVLLLLLTVALSRSSIGFMGLFLVIYIFGTRYRLGTVFAPAAIVALALGIYAVSPDFQLRVDDSITGFRMLGEAEINSSSWAIVSGALVSGKALQSYPLLGGGLGSISMINDSYVGTLRGANFVDSSILQEARGDAASMLLRLAGETGLIGLTLCFGFLWYYFPRGGDTVQKRTALSIVVYAFLKLLRSGVYLSPEFLFLFTIYAVNGAPSFRRVLARSRLALQSGFAREQAA